MTAVEGTRRHGETRGTSLSFRLETTFVLHLLQLPYFVGADLRPEKDAADQGPAAQWRGRGPTQEAGQALPGSDTSLRCLPGTNSSSSGKLSWRR